MNQKYSVAIIDEHPLLAEGVIQVLRSAGQFEIVGSGSNAEDAVAIARNKKPDMMIFEISIPGGGLEAARRVSAASPETKVVFLTSTENDDNVATALRDGAKGYILKGIEKGEFIRIIADIGGGRFYVNPGVAARMLGRNRDRNRGPHVPSGLDDLTHRELEIITFVAHGKTNREVATALRLGEKTVKHHMTSIMQKLQVRNRLEAVLMLKDKLSPATAGESPALSITRPAATINTGMGRNNVKELWRVASGDGSRRR